MNKKRQKAVSSHIPYKNPAITEWKKRYGLKLLEKGFSIHGICEQIDCSETMWYQWKRRDKLFWEKVNAIEKTVKKNREHIWTDLVMLIEKIKPYLQRDMTEKEACAESGISYETWRSLKKDLRKSKSEMAEWFFLEIENAKSKVFALAKNTLTSGIKVNPLLAFNFLKSRQPDIYTDGRKELTGAKWEKLFHAFPMKPWDYEDFVKRASTIEDDENE